ncbi:Mu-like prophage major head subunit gpT [compost metagenome]
MIWQTRRAFALMMKNKPQDSDHVFMNDEILWGTDGRCNAGFGLWQLAFGSKASLTGDNFDAAMAAMMGFKNDAGSPLGIVPDLLVTGPKNRAKAKAVLDVMFKEGGASNPNYQEVDLLVTPWLA